MQSTMNQLNNMAAAALGNQPRGMVGEMKGLSTFIADIRNCRSRELEEKRINKELGHIRQKFKEGNLTGYDRKKYVSKLLFMYILGYQIDFGHVEAVNLVASAKYKEKQIGYLAVTLLFHENKDALHLVINSFKKDLDLENDHVNCLVLNTIANVGGALFAETLGADVVRKLIGNTSSLFVKKKAALCLLKLYRKCPSAFLVDEWADKLIQAVLHCEHGVLTSLTSLLIDLATERPALFAPVIPHAVQRLCKLAVERSYQAHELYYKIPIPWLQVKLLRLLRAFETPTSDPRTMDKFNLVVQTLIANSQENIKNQQQINAQNAIFFEAVQLLIQWQPNSQLFVEVERILTKLLSGTKDSNARFLTLDVYSLMLNNGIGYAGIRAQEEAIVAACRDRDMTVRRQALDVLYRMCDTGNGPKVTTELLKLLGTAEDEIKEVLALRIAILAEKFAPSFDWYFKTMCDLITKAGTFTSDDVWHRMVQLMSARTLQECNESIALVFQHVQNPGCHETMIRVAAYMLGERADTLVDRGAAAPIDIFQAIHRHFAFVAQSTKCLMLTTYIKLVNLFPEIRPMVEAVLAEHVQSMDVELQERACEYLNLLNLNSDEVLAAICEEMPPFRDRRSALEQKLEEKEKRKTAASPTSAAGAGSPTVGSAQPSSPVGMGGGNLLDMSVEAPAPVLATTVPRSVTATSMMNEIVGGPATSASPNNIFSAPSPSGGSPLMASFAQTQSADATPTVAMLVRGHQEKLARFFYANEGILYQDAVLQIGAIVKPTPPAGTIAIVLYLGNLTDRSVDALQLTTSCPPECKLTVVDPPRSIGASQQERVSMLVTYMAPPAAPVLVRVRYAPVSAMATNDITLRVPALFTAFAEPITANPTQFLAQWTRIAPATDDVRACQLAPPKSINVEWLRAHLAEKMRWGVVPAAGPQDRLVVRAAARFTCGANVMNHFTLLEIVVAETLRECRITARSSPSPAANRAVLEAMQHIIYVTMHDPAAAGQA
ncbi:hypothetical protein AMAG_03453 [Allomyces macrogynus ATCC 38327]|uniref:AP-2 complex subunit alpha n=1 Tax=Allomyces macrogynus (strain ATCC 38327) TaxID=578462 RepID=A0A0L0S948_ALLM3|nr:hypothetical protein AMAG_03453 [Allomyces macrogynus ATCC 38327]|eukprot:KNE59113.1 hypothetical protein AMAG_03453 [Allomyces macrogynus ATCC 38327]